MISNKDGGIVPSSILGPTSPSITPFGEMSWRSWPHQFVPVPVLKTQWKGAGFTCPPVYQRCSRKWMFSFQFTKLSTHIRGMFTAPRVLVMRKKKERAFIGLVDQNGQKMPDAVTNFLPPIKGARRVSIRQHGIPQELYLRIKQFILKKAALGVEMIVYIQWLAEDVFQISIQYNYLSGSNPEEVKREFAMALSS